MKEVELLWNGKTDEVEKTVLPFQTIEQIDEPRSEDVSGFLNSRAWIAYLDMIRMDDK